MQSESRTESGGWMEHAGLLSFPVVASLNRADLHCEDGVPCPSSVVGIDRPSAPALRSGVLAFFVIQATRSMVTRIPGLHLVLTHSPTGRRDKSSLLKQTPAYLNRIVKVAAGQKISILDTADMG